MIYLKVDAGLDQEQKPRKGFIVLGEDGLIVDFVSVGAYDMGILNKMYPKAVGGIELRVTSYEYSNLLLWRKLEK